jgi:rhodanese-related sulfurtransferase
MKKTIVSASIAVLLGVVCVLTLMLGIQKVLVDSAKLPDIPLPELSEGMRGELGIDKNVNEQTIDKYLNRSDSVYRDMRMLVDTANYEAIGGDRYLSGVVDSFEVVPMPYLIEPEGLPEAVGKAYSGKTLFSRLKNGKVVANYSESNQILEDLFPKNKNIFLMCGGGGYAGMTKKLLVDLGWDENKIWNVGGFWYYEGDNKIDIKQKDGTYAFWKLKYHIIDFNAYHEV